MGNFYKVKLYKVSSLISTTNIEVVDEIIVEKKRKRFFEVSQHYPINVVEGYSYICVDKLIVHFDGTYDFTSTPGSRYFIFKSDINDNNLASIDDVNYYPERMANSKWPEFYYEELDKTTSNGQAKVKELVRKIFGRKII